MKKFKSLVFMLALALIFAGATKASAAEEGKTVTITVTGEATLGTATFTVDESTETITPGETLVPSGATVEITYTLTDGLDAEDVEVTVTPDTLTKADGKVSFTMGEEAVTVTIDVEKVEPGAGGENGGENGGEGISKISVLYDKEYIEVESDEQVFFQIVKSATDLSKVKAANWIKAAKSGDKYAIDYSATANTKDVIYALTVDATTTDAAKIKTATVDAAIKSAKITLNYKTETLAQGGLYDIIAGIVVKGIDAEYNKEWTNADKDATLASLFTLNWKRGANGTWAAADTFDQLNWDMVKASNSTLYINIDGAKGSGDAIKEFRPSKETKLKVPKAAKAPTVKVDYVKGTVALKNGMQIKVDDSAEWMDVIALTKETATAPDEKTIFALASAGLTTKTKVSSVAVADFVTAARDVLKATAADGTEIKVEVRTAATDKKFPSNSGIFKMVLPKAAPAVVNTEVALTYTKADKSKDVAAAYTIDFSNIFTDKDGIDYSKYEYVFVANIDDGVNLTKQKWTKLDSTGKVDLAKNIGKEYKYYKTGEAKTATEIAYEAIDAIYVRLAAIKPASSKEAGVFASDYAKVDVKVTEVIPTTPEDGEGEDEGETTEFTVTFTVDDATKITELKVADKDASLTNKAVKAAKDAAVTFKYTAATGKVAKVMNGSTAVTADANGVYKVTVTADVTIVITEEDETKPDTPTTYAITINKAEGFEGTVEAQVNGAKAEAAAADATVTIVYTAKTDGATKELDTIAVVAADGETAVEVTDNAFTMPAQGVTVTVTEKAKTVAPEE